MKQTTHTLEKKPLSQDVRIWKDGERMTPESMKDHWGNVDAYWAKLPSYAGLIKAAEATMTTSEDREKLRLMSLRGM